MKVLVHAKPRSKHPSVRRAEDGLFEIAMNPDPAQKAQGIRAGFDGSVSAPPTQKSSATFIPAASGGTFGDIPIKEPPEDGKANRAIACSLAKHLGIAPSLIRLVSGARAKRKVFELN